MKLALVCSAVLLAAGAYGVASATPTNLIQNGDFSSITTSTSANCPQGSGTPTQFSSAWHCGEFINHWKGNGGYEIWYPSAYAAGHTQAVTEWGNTGHQYLPDTITAPPVGSGTFVGLDGASDIRGGISQDLSGLVAGATYVVSFYWGATQEMSKTGKTTEQFKVSLGGASQYTPLQHVATHGWTGWMYQSFSFVATGANETLNFLSIGSPGNEPPFGVLTDVSVTKRVPEPPELVLFGGGLLALGVMTVFARRRALRQQGAAGGRDIA